MCRVPENETKNKCKYSTCWQNNGSGLRTQPWSASHIRLYVPSIDHYIFTLTLSSMAKCKSHPMGYHTWNVFLLLPFQRSYLKVRAKMSLCLTKYNATKTYLLLNYAPRHEYVLWCVSIAPRILNLGTTCRWMGRASRLGRFTSGVRAPVLIG
jgi:hypothetical protein